MAESGFRNCRDSLWYPCVPKDNGRAGWKHFSSKMFSHSVGCPQKDVGDALPWIPLGASTIKDRQNYEFTDADIQSYQPSAAWNALCVASGYDIKLAEKVALVNNLRPTNK